jgi:curved DNA-binding protein CbpA
MKLDSKYFDSIRVSTKRKKAARAQPDPEDIPQTGCQWKGCENQAKHRAPMGRGRDGEFFYFCADHVRQYNASYNYFDGMSDSQIQEFQRDARTGHRPTWKVGSNESGAKKKSGADAKTAEASSFAAYRAAKAKATRTKGQARRRKLRPLEKKSFDAMSLPENATKDEVKARFKQLVKEHHPDANGGDKGAEDKLREIIQAYNYLKTAGMV